MKKLLYFLGAIVVLVLMAALGIYLHFKPSYSGTAELPGLEKETTVYYDTFAVPHVYASSEKDALYALGFLHAKERLWQMELLRRIGKGELAAIFGAPALKADQFFLSIGLNANSETVVKSLDVNAAEYQLTQAYLQGVNHYLANETLPIEFSILGVDPRPFDMVDVYNIFGYMSFSFAMAQRTDPLMTSIRKDLGSAYLKDFGLDGKWNQLSNERLSTLKSDFSEISQQINEVLEAMPVGPFIGSNSFIIAPEKTVSGNVIFENDPHISFSQPGTWYETHLHTPEYEIYGHYLPGIPFPLLGFNRQMAYGLTMFENDDIDFFTVKSADVKTVKSYEIVVKDSTKVKLDFKATKLGPIVNETVQNLTKETPVAMRWVYLQRPNKLLTALYDMSHAKSYRQFNLGKENIHAPGLNVMYGSASDTIAWTASAALYKLHESVNPNFILDGTSPTDTLTIPIPFTENPSEVNPSSGFIASANYAPKPVGNYAIPGYYLPHDRQSRITDLLKSKQKWTAEDIRKMTFDDVSPVSKFCAQQMVSLIDYQKLNSAEKSAYDLLKSWDGAYRSDSKAAGIYTLWLSYVFEYTFRDELGRERFEQLIPTHAFKQSFAPLLANPNSVWWDNRNTPRVESRAFIVAAAFQKAVAGIPVGTVWKDVHTLEVEHPIGKVQVLRKLFNVGGAGISGGNEVVNSMLFAYGTTLPYQVKAGPSTRRVIDFSEIENAMGILPTGQSGNPFSKHYDDQYDLFIHGKFRPMLLNKKQIIDHSTRLVLKPNR